MFSDDRVEKESKTEESGFIYTIIKRNDKSALIEYVEGDGVFRVTVPVRALEKMTKDKASKGVPYGLPWREAFDDAPLGKKIEAQLYKAGVWTQDDLRRQHKAALGVLMSVMRVSLSRLNEFAARAAKEV